MAIDIRPATVFGDVRTMVGPKRADANVCWCLSYRLSSKDDQALRGSRRGILVEKLVRRNPPPGVLAYDGDEVVGWAGVHPPCGYRVRHEPQNPARRRSRCVVGLVQQSAARASR